MTEKRIPTQNAHERMRIDIFSDKHLFDMTKEMLEPDDRTDEEKKAAAEKEAEEYNAEWGSLDSKVYNCPICRNKGDYKYVRYYKGSITEYYCSTKECDCKKLRKELERLRSLGISIKAEKLTFDNFRHDTPWQEQLYSVSKGFLDRGNEFMIYISGQPGCGKTHICTALFIELMRQGKTSKYMSWIDTVQKLKRCAHNDEEYTRVINTYKNAPVLYIDDFLKPVKQRDGTISAANDADLRIAFELINQRYNNSLITIISSENSFSELENIDEAIASRIYEAAGGRFITYVQRAEDRNVRLANSE